MARILSGFVDADVWEERDGRIIRRNHTNTYAGALLSGFTIEEWIERKEAEKAAERAFKEKAIETSKPERALSVFLTHWGSKKSTAPSPKPKQHNLNPFFEPVPPRRCIRCDELDDEEEDHLCITSEEKQALKDWVEWYAEVNGLDDSEELLCDYEQPRLRAGSKRRRTTHQKKPKFEPKAQKRVSERGLVRIELETPEELKESLEWDSMVDHFTYDQLWNSDLSFDCYSMNYEYTDCLKIIHKFVRTLDQKTHPTLRDVEREWNLNKARILADYKPKAQYPFSGRYYEYDFDNLYDYDEEYERALRFYY